MEFEALAEKKPLTCYEAFNHFGDAQAYGYRFQEDHLK
jgi:hypothetical protein